MEASFKQFNGFFDVWSQFVRFWIRIGGSCVGIDSKGYAKINNISTNPSQSPKSLIWDNCCLYCLYFTCFETKSNVSQVLPDQSLTGVGYIDADWKVSTFTINLIFGVCTNSSKSEVKVCLTMKSWIQGLWVLIGCLKGYQRVTKGVLKAY